VVQLDLDEPPRQDQPGREPLRPEHADVRLPRLVRQLGNLGPERGGRRGDVRELLRRGSLGARLDVVVAGLLAQVAGRLHAGARPDQQLPQRVRVPGHVRQHVPAGPAWQQGGLGDRIVAQRLDRHQQAPSRLVDHPGQLVVHPLIIADTHLPGSDPAAWRVRARAGRRRGWDVSCLYGAP